MATAAGNPPTQSQETVDLAALGSTWQPKEQMDSSPEVSEILAQMPWWAARGLVYLMLIFVTTALLWAALSQLDVIGEAKGTLVPEGYSQPVQAPAGGVVEHVLVREGDRVAQGDALIQLDRAEPSARLAALESELAVSKQQAQQLFGVGRSLSEVLEQQNRIAGLQGEITAARQAMKYTTICAPASGIVTLLDVRRDGSVIQAGQRIADIVPEGAPLLLEAWMPNADAGFVEPGMPAKLKLDAFPFQDYGIVPGTVVDVSADARIDEQNGTARFKVLIRPGQTSIRARGKDVPLRPGLTAAAEIVTRRMSVLDLVLSPLRKLKGDLETTR